VVAERASSDDSAGAERATIKVYVRDLDQLFDSMDPSPFHEKDLDRNAHEYIVSIARELPVNAPAELVVYLDHQVGLPEEATVLGEAIRVYFSRQAADARRKLKQELRFGWISLIIGLTFLVSSVVVGQRVARHYGQGPLATVVRESLLIGGWVAMWRPMDFFLYEWWQMRSDVRVLERLSQADVQIIYTGTEPAGAGEGEPRRAAPGPRVNVPAAPS
jgi:hypothetical protein